MESETNTKKSVPWEYQLTAELVLDGILPIKQAYADLPLLRMEAMTCLDPKQSSQFVHEKLNELVSWVQYVKQIFDEDINKSWSPPGIEGNRADIEASASKLVKALWALYTWEKSIVSVITDPAWNTVFKRLRLSTEMWINDVESFFLDFKKQISDPDVSGQLILNFIIKVPKQLMGAEKDISKAQCASLPKDQWDNLALDILKSLMVLAT